MDPPKPTPEQEFRRKTIADGEWTPIPVSDLDEMLRDLVRKGEEFPDWAARLDLRYWADKGSIKAVTYYQKRWKWKGRQRTYDLLKEFGLKGQDGGKTRERFENDSRTKKERFENDNPGESPGIEEAENVSRTKKERFENNSRTVYPEAYSEEEVREGGNARARYPAGDDNPHNPHGYPPEEDAVKAFASKSGLDPEEAWTLAEHWGSQGWKRGNGQLITNWQLAINSRLKGNRKHGKATQRTPGRASGRAQSDYQQGREVGRNGVDVDSYVEFSDTYLAGVDEEIEQRRRRKRPDPGGNDPDRDVEP